MKKITQKELDKMIFDYEQWMKNGEIIKYNAYPIFADADFSSLSFKNANLYHARFDNSILIGCNFRRANLERVNFRKANLSRANLKEANLFRADLYQSIIDGVKVDEYTKFFHPICPEEGNIIGYKKVRADNGMQAIAKLFIPDNAKRNSATTYRCRADKAIVLEIIREDGMRVRQAVSAKDSTFVYTEGKCLSVRDFDLDRWHETSTGIHFYLSKEIARLY